MGGVQAGRTEFSWRLKCRVCWVREVMEGAKDRRRKTKSTMAILGSPREHDASHSASSVTGMLLFLEVKRRRRVFLLILYGIVHVGMMIEVRRKKKKKLKDSMLRF